MTAHLHSIRWQGPDDATFACTCDSACACRNYPACDCEVWTIGHDKQPGHESVPQDECWVMPWLNATTPSDTFYDSATPSLDLPEDRRDGPIETEWDDGGVLWHYSRQAVSA